MPDNANKNSYLSNTSEGKFVSLEELNNMDFLGGRQLSNGLSEYSSTKQWTKNIKDIESEQKNYKQIIAEIKKIDGKIDAILNKLEQNENKNIQDGENTMDNSNIAAVNNFSWKDKLRGMVK